VDEDDRGLVGTITEITTLKEENARLRLILDQACEEIDLLRRYLIAAMPPRAVMQAIRLHLDRPAPTAGYTIERLREEARKRYEPTDNQSPSKEPTA
jgi:hypothetical protein